MVTRRGLNALVALAATVVAYPDGYIGGGDLTLQIFESDCSTPKSFPVGYKPPTHASSCVAGSAADGNSLAIKENTCCSMGQDLNGGSESFSVGGSVQTSYGKFVCGDDGVANIFLYADDECTLSSAPNGLENMEKGAALGTCKPLTLYFADANEPTSPAKEMFVQHQLVCRQGFPIWAAVLIPAVILSLMIAIAIFVYVRRYKKHKKDAAENQRIALWRRWAAQRAQWGQGQGQGQGQGWGQRWNQWRPQWSQWNPWAQPTPQRQQPYMQSPAPQSWHHGQEMSQMNHHHQQAAPAPHVYAGQTPVPSAPPMPRPVPVSMGQVPPQGAHYAGAPVAFSSKGAKGSMKGAKGSMKGKGKGKGPMSNYGPVSMPPPGKGAARPMSMPPTPGKGMRPGPPSLASFPSQGSRRPSMQSQRGAFPPSAMNRGRSPGPRPMSFRPSSLPPSVADRDEVLGRSRLNSFAGPQYSARGA